MILGQETQPSVETFELRMPNITLDKVSLLLCVSLKIKYFRSHRSALKQAAARSELN